MSGAYVLKCNEADYNATTGECAAPYYASSAESMWYLSVSDGLLFAGAIWAVWTIGLVARVLIRTAQQGMKS